MKLKNKIVIVTGAAGGIGEALVGELLEKGNIVLGVDISEDRLHKLKSNIVDDNLYTYVCDLTQIESVKSLSVDIIKTHGHVDCLINNAGMIQPFIKVSTIDYSYIEKVMKVNFYSALYMSKTFIPYLLERDEAHILNVSSMGGCFPVAGQVIYGASKAALKLLSEGLASELSETNINVSVALPGAMDTNIKKNSYGDTTDHEQDKENSHMKVLSPEKAASKLLKVIEKNKLISYIGKDSKIMNLLYKLNPKFAPKIMYSAVKTRLQ
ncbi:MAG: SDR family NAD(P)-dependent oxidoreductase [Sphaerochaetaceae bacterium]|nr:SDR family NAD(P)-dependent oxidoreductase [Sphaerochaetaceae bacterium]